MNNIILVLIISSLVIVLNRETFLHFLIMMIKGEINLLYFKIELLEKRREKILNRIDGFKKRVDQYSRGELNYFQKVYLLVDYNIYSFIDKYYHGIIKDKYINFIDKTKK